MTKKASRYADREVFWRHHIAASEKSGQPLIEYCRRHQLSDKSYYYWRKRLKTLQQKGSASKAGGFVPVLVQEPAFTGLKVRLPNGLVVEGGNAEIAELLLRLLTVGD